MREQSLITGVCSVALGVPDVEKARDFYQHIWGLVPVPTESGAFFKGAGEQPWLLSLWPTEETQIIHADLQARSVQDMDVLAARLKGLGIAASMVRLDHEPGGGSALCFTDPRGRHLRVRADFSRAEPMGDASDMPTKITHLVLNSENAIEDASFYSEILGLSVIDETVIMFFMNADADHHSLAFSKTDNRALNHIAFEMPSLDAVMRGAGRMRDAKYPIDWGVGRHGPGANVFSYFVGPCGEVIEYTGEIEQVDHTYKPGSPTDWKWPAGRNDRWGVGIGPTEALKAAQRRVMFASAPPRSWSLL